MNLYQAMAALRHDCDYIIFGGTYEGIQWNDKNQTKPTKEEVENYINTQNEWEAINIPLELCKQKAKELIAQTDWAMLQDVGLKNVPDYVTYRGILRGLIITPVADPVWPTEPTPIWE